MQGLILVNKPTGITSFSAVSQIKRAASEKRVGHTGTLDPLATGVLPILIGRPTVLSSHLLDGDKTYVATIKLGITTDSCDITGNVISQAAVNVDNRRVIEALESFKGEITQTPPMFSALKKDGVRLYELARKGIEVEIPQRNITIYSIVQTKPLNAQNEFEIEARVSKGTYIRSLCRDIGNFLGTGAAMKSLCRTEASGFSLKDCIPLSDISQDNISNYILNEETAVSHLREIFVTENQARRFSNGGQLSYERLKTNDFLNGQILRVKYNEQFLGLGVADNENKQICIECVINQYK